MPSIESLPYTRRTQGWSSKTLNPSIENQEWNIGLGFFET
jgi:hypothetical protein